MTRLVRRITRSRAFALLTAIGLIGAANSGLVGVGSATTGGTGPDTADEVAPMTHPVTKTLTDTCVFGKVAQPVTFEITATIPTAVVQGKPVRITDFTVKFTLPRSALPQPDPLVSIEGGASLDLVAKRENKQTHVPVALDIATTAIPGSGNVALIATGTPDPVAMTVSGQLDLELGAPKLALKTTKDSTAEQVTCTAGADQSSTLGSVAILPGTGKPDQGNQDQTPTKDTPGSAQAGTPNAPDPNVIVVTLDPLSVNGASTVRKLGAKVPIGPSVIIAGHVLLDAVDPNAPLISEGDTLLPPSQVSFLGFGFMPITGTLEFLPLDYQVNRFIPLRAIVTIGSDQQTYGSSHIDVYGRLSNVKINGVPLDVGPKCVSATPIAIDLYGPYDAFAGGVLKTDPKSPDPAVRGFTIPPFDGCGATEPLSPILSGMSSGPMNQATVTVQPIILKPADSARPPMRHR